MSQAREYKYRLNVTFSQEWVLEHREDESLPVEWLISQLHGMYNISDVRASLNEYEGVIAVAARGSVSELIDSLSGLIWNKYDLEQSSTVFEIVLNEYEETEGDDADAVDSTDENSGASSGKKKTSSDRPVLIKKETSDGGAGSVMEKIAALSGAREFKSLCEECSKVAEAVVRRNIKDSFTCRSYVISVNDGCGLTTYLNLFADLLEKLGLFQFTSKTRVAETALRPPDQRSGIENEFSSALSYFRGQGGKVVCIDISEWITKLSDKRFRDFLHSIEEHAGENIVFFRVPFVEKNVVKDIVYSINDMLFVKEISVTPFSGDELRACAERFISEKGFVMDEEAWTAFDRRISEEKSDGRFYGVNTVLKIVRELLYVKELYNVENGLDDNIIKEEEISGLTLGDPVSSKNGFDQLASLIGMESVAERVREIIAQIEASSASDSLEAPCIHMRFVGNPGTGKTTVARILGKILKERGILRNGCFFEYSGRSLCGQYVGETAPKTSAICRDAYGSVLFIDEAYSLYRDNSMSRADYGIEALDTLIAEMENHRSDLVVIMAGYPDEMEKLMKGNVGLKSRMPFLIEFPNYTRTQLAEIFMSMVNKGGFRYEEDFKDAVFSYFESLSDSVIEDKSFSNARYVRNLFERMWGKAALRSQLSGTACDNLMVEDLALATSDGEFQNILEQKKRTIGFDSL